MKFGPVPVDVALGRRLGHNVAGPDGRRLLTKGRALGEEDLALLRRLGRRVVYVAELEPGDCEEEAAARRVAAALDGAERLERAGGPTGRVNLRARGLGLVRVDAARLEALNGLDGLTVASLADGRVARRGQTVATVKILPFALPEATVRRAEAIAREGGPVVTVDPIPSRPVGWILSGSASVRERLAADFAPLRARVEALGSRLVAEEWVDLDDEGSDEALVAALVALRERDVALILLAGETAIMDRADRTPRAIERAGGRIEAYGAPVDPGNLLLLAELAGVPVVGVPGCARSARENVVDWILPRLLAGDRIRRDEIARWGHGGLLEDVAERPLPRERIGSPAAD